VVRPDARYGRPCECGDGFCAGCDNDPDNTDGLPVAQAALTPAEIGTAAVVRALRGAHRPLRRRLVATTWIEQTIERFDGVERAVAEVRISLTDAPPTAFERLRSTLAAYLLPDDSVLWIRLRDTTICVACWPANAPVVRDDVTRIIGEVL
jgi:hypothetical protein